MNKIYKIGTRRFDEYELERMYNVLDELRYRYVYDFERFITLSACMEELTKRSKRLKALAERGKYEQD